MRKLGATWLGCVLAALFVAGCGGDDPEPMNLDWDLSDGNEVSRVDLQRPDLSASELKPIESLRLRLPEGQDFAPEDGAIHDVTVAQDGEKVLHIQVDSHPLEVDPAYDLALEWARQFDLPLEPIESWHRSNASGEADRKTRAQTSGPPEDTIGEDGPLATVQIRNSFLDDRPGIVSIKFFWELGRI